MKIILLSGGSGKRLWPLSNEARSKQFLKVLQDKEGNSESMIQRIYRQIRQSRPDADVLIAASEAQSDPIRRQIGAQAETVFEPSRRHTYPAILLAGAYLLDKKQIGEKEVIAVLPVDPYVEQDYFEKLGEMEQALADSGAQVCLLGVRPTYPSEKYGYMTGEPVEGKHYCRVTAYAEKPGLETARRLVEEGGRWNGGVFVMRACFVRELIEKEIGQVSFDRLYEQYDRLPCNSFDYEVSEKNASLVYIPYEGEWKDMGTWNTLTERMEKPDGGFVVRGEACRNTHVINELAIPVVALGLRDMVVVASADGILVSDKHASSYMQRYVEQIDNRPMYEKRQWGEYKVLDIAPCRAGKENSLTKHLHVEAGRSLSYQAHELRDEVWTIIDGKGLFLLDGEIREAVRGDVLYIPKGHKHGMATRDGVDFIEVQLGTELVEEDIERFPWDWDEFLTGTDRA